MKPLFILEYGSAVKLTDEQARALFTAAELEAGKQEGRTVCHGPWQLVSSYTALCTSNTFNRDVYPVEHGPLHVYGKRTLSRPRESGYQLEGTVSVGGRKLRGFTSSQLFELPGGKLISAATIHACGAAEPQRAATGRVQ